MVSRDVAFRPLLLLILFGLTQSACSKGGTVAGNSPDAPSEGESKVVRCLEDASAPRVPPRDAPDTIDVAHVLVRHSGLSSPKEVTRRRGAACLRALAALEALQGGATWNSVVDEYSDSGRATHGELGRVSREQLEPAFGDAAFALSPQELSYVVETSRGFHVILRNN